MFITKNNKFNDKHNRYLYYEYCAGNEKIGRSRASSAARQSKLYSTVSTLQSSTPGNLQCSVQYTYTLGQMKCTLLVLYSNLLPVVFR